MTATPRFIGAKKKKSAEELGQEINSMCDKSKFGSIFHKLNFSEAIEGDILSNYQVVIIGVKSDKEKKFAVEGRFIKIGKQWNTDARTLASSIGLAKAIQKYKLKKVITFHSSVAKAKSFADENKTGSLFSVFEKLPKDIKGNTTFWTRSIYGQMPVGKRQDILSQLKSMKGNSVGVIANCSCLGEGVDVPTLDGVAFIDPKRSQVDIIQAVGRVIRKSESKKIGTVVLPVFIGDNDDPEEILKSSAFEPVWAVIKALKSHDDILSDKLDEFRISLGQPNKRITLPSNIKIHIPKNLNLSLFQKAFTVKTVKVSTTTWDGMIKLLKEYKNKYGHFDPPNKMPKRWEELFEWAHKIRLDKRSENLPFERVAELNEIKFDWKIPGVTIDDTSGLLNEKQFAKFSKLTKIYEYRREGLIIPIGVGISEGSGTSYFYKPSQAKELRKKLGITLLNTSGLLTERQFAKKMGLSKTSIARFRKKSLLKPRGFAIFVSKLVAFYHPRQVRGLKSKLGITLSTTKGLISEIEFAKKIKISTGTIRRYRKTKKVIPKGFSFLRGALLAFYHPDEIKRLRNKLGITLLDTTGLLSELDFMKLSGFSSLVLYVEKGLISPIGIGLNNNGSVGRFYHRKQIIELRNRLGITISDTRNLLNETQFAKRFGVSLGTLIRYRDNGKIKPIGKGMNLGGVGYFYKRSQINELKKELGITLNNTKGLVSEVAFAKLLGINASTVARYRKNGLIKPKGYALSITAISPYYHPSQVAKLKKKLKNK